MMFGGMMTSDDEYCDENFLHDYCEKHKQEFLQWKED